MSANCFSFCGPGPQTSVPQTHWAIAPLVKIPHATTAQAPGAVQYALICILAGWHRSCLNQTLVCCHVPPDKIYY